MTQLERDLRRRFHERLSTIIGDTFELYEMAELDPRDAGIVVAHELLAAFVKVSLIVNNDIQPSRQTVETIAAALTALFETERRRNERTKT